MTWTTYDVGNPVIPTPPQAYANQLNNFRDPFVFWHDPSQKWTAVVSLAQLHKLLIYTSTNLKDWTQVSEFGPINAIGGVWECPSIFPLPLDGDEANIKWIAQIGLNPGGPPGTSPAQGTLPGQQTVTGYQGNRLVNTLLNGDQTTGTLTSPSFNITHKNINFLIGGEISRAKNALA